MEKKLRASLRRLGVEKRDNLLLAVSGGTDSTALWDALARWSGNLSVVHLNHQLRGAESDADENFVRAMAVRLETPVFIASADIAARAKQTKKNLEATARQARYEFLLHTAHECETKFILTAHTQDDQAETILMRLLRGTGAAGLQGIHAKMKLSENVALVRPLLHITRAEVLAHCQHYALDFRADSSNDSIDFMRNRVRHEVLPLLRTFNPGFAATLVRTAAQISEDEDFWQAQAQEILTSLVEGATLNFLPLLSLHTTLRRRVLRLWIQQARGDLRRIGASHLSAVESLLMHGEGGSYVELPGGWQVQRCGKTLKLQPK